MSHVPVQKAGEEAKDRFPIFSEIRKRFEDVRKKAFELFEKRGGEPGRDLDDWLTAESEILGWPTAEMREKNDAYELEVALPGFDPKEIEVTAADHEIAIHAKTSHEKKEEKEKVVWSEFGSNDVYRWFATPEPIAIDKVAATLEKGLLRIRVPKGAEAGRRQVNVAAA